METFPRLAEEVYTVSRLTQEIKNNLEVSFPSLWVEGELSNFRVPSSGHFYFTLKDDASQIRVVMFRSRNQSLPFIPEDGMQVTLRASLSVYPPRGEYQLIAEWMEPRGHGALQLAFEALKQRLADEGLFDTERKKPIPFLPREIGVITSPTGAAIRDILKVLWRRFPDLSIRFCPVRVQGDQAKEEIVEALQMLNQEGRAEVIILGRGGGSLEDLWAFNEETVARAIADSNIPVVSAVGHEIDFTIADFVADLRAPTPSAAAEIVIPERNALVRNMETLKSRLQAAGAMALERKREALYHLSRRMIHPGRRIQEGYVRLDELSDRLTAAENRHVRQLSERLEGLGRILHRLSPVKRIEILVATIESLHRDLCRLITHEMRMKRQRWKEAAGRLGSLSPLGVLSRGYSITRLLPSEEILRTAEHVQKGDSVGILLAKGGLECSVEVVVPEKSEHE